MTKTSPTETRSSGSSATTQQATAPNSGQAQQAENEAKTEAKSPTRLKSEGGGIAALIADHRAVEALFARYEKAPEGEEEDLAGQICQSLVLHTKLEETIFYPACREAFAEEDQLDEAQIEHDLAGILIADLLRGGQEGEQRDAKVKVLSEQIKHHVGEEETPRSGLFAKARAANLDTPELADRLSRFREKLERQQLEAGPPRAVRISKRASRPHQEEMEMAGRSMERSRDERGRFRDDDDRQRGGRYDDDRRMSGRNSESSGRDRDEYGRFTSDDRGSPSRARREDDDGGRSPRGRDDEDRGYRSRSGHYEDDDDDRRSHGGWFGDSQGHAEASRRGWEHRDDRGGNNNGGRSRGYDDDDRGGYRSRSSRYDDDNDGRGRGGWFGDSRGHSEAARRGWEDRR